MIKCLQVFYSLGRGGAETVMVNYIKQIVSRRGIDIDVLVHKRVQNGYESDVLSLGIEILECPTIKEIGLGNYIKKLESIFNIGKYDVVHIHMDGLDGFVAFAAHRAKVKKIICHSHSTGIIDKVGLHGLIICRLLMQVSHVSRMACGDQAGKALFGNEKFEVLKNGINASSFIISEEEKYKLKESIGVPQDARIILHVGRFDKAKNQIFLINLADRVLAENPNTYFVFVGGGLLFDEIDNIRKQLKYTKRVILLGIRSDVPSIMCSSDIFVMPSIYEGLPVTLIEAQCAGLPCILADSITSEADCNINEIQFLKLEPTLWIEAINGALKIKTINAEERIKKIKERGYDIIKNSKFLEDYYLEENNGRNQ